MTSPFTIWLFQQTGRSDLVGVFARFASQDTFWPFAEPWRGGLKKYLMEQEAPPLSFEALDQVWGEFVSVLAKEVAGETFASSWNFIVGCDDVSLACKSCGAKALSNFLHRGRPERFPPDFRLTIHDDQLSWPLWQRTPQQITAVELGDLFHEAVPDEVIHQAFQVMVRARWHTFVVITKRIERMVAMDLPWMPHILAATSIEKSDYLFRLDLLRKVPAPLRLVSFTPLLGPVGELDLSGIHYVETGGTLANCFAPLDGKAGLMPDPPPFDENWVRDIRDQCRKAGVSFTYSFKQQGDELIQYPSLDGRCHGPLSYSEKIRF